MLWPTLFGRGRSQGVGRNHGVGLIEYDNVDGVGGLLAAILIGSKFVLSFFGSSGDFWGYIAEYRHVYSAIEGIQCTIYIRFYMVCVSCKFEYT